MLTFYLCFLAGGAVFPFINFIIGLLSGGIDHEVDSSIDGDVDFDLDGEVPMDGDVGMDTGSTLPTADDLDAVNRSFDADLATDVGTGKEVRSEADVTSGEGSIFSLGLIPTSLLSISALAITFGAAGAIMTLGRVPSILSFILAAICGYIASVMIQTILKTLKRVQTISNGVNENELLLYDGKIIDTILPGQMGTVSFVTLKNVRVSYPAKCEDVHLKIETGRIVKAKDFKNGVFIVEPKNKYEI